MELFYATIRAALHRLSTKHTIARGILEGEIVLLNCDTCEMLFYKSFKID